MVAYFYAYSQYYSDGAELMQGDLVVSTAWFLASTFNLLRTPIFLNI